MLQASLVPSMSNPTRANVFSARYKFGLFDNVRSTKASLCGPHIAISNLVLPVLEDCNHSLCHNHRNVANAHVVAARA